MDSVQGIIPLKSIPFRLESQTSEEATAPDSSHIECSTAARTSFPEAQFQTEARDSPCSVDSNSDVNAYTEQKVRLKKEAQLLAQQQATQLTVDDPEETDQCQWLD